MSLKETIELIIKATDKSASKELKKVEKELEQVSQTAKQSSESSAKSISKINQSVKSVFDSVKKLGNSSTHLNKISSKAKEIGNTIKTSISNGVKTATGSLERLGVPITSIGNKFTQLKNKITTTFNGIGGKLKTSITGLGKLGEAVGKTSQRFRLLRNAISMTVGMLGFEFVNACSAAVSANLKARGEIQSYGQKLGMTASKINEFNHVVSDFSSKYPKTDMQVAASTAMDIAYRYDLGTKNLKELTETSIVFGAAMAANGRNGVDTTLALADALDGEFRRLKEIGITQDKLKDNGWNGDINDKTSLIKALNAAMAEQHYDILATQIMSYKDAWNALTIGVSSFISDLLNTFQPVIIFVTQLILKFFQAFKSNDLVKISGLVIGIVGALSILTSVIMSKVIPSIVTFAFDVLTAMGASTAALDAFVIEGEFSMGAFTGALMGGEVSIRGFAATLYSSLAPILLPILAITAAIIGIAIAIYEVGKYFGWWKDFDSMLESISAGLNRLWSAFINNPNVKGTIEDISNAFKFLWDILTPIGSALMDFFGIPKQGEANFDIVRAIIDFFGILADIIGKVVNAVKTGFSAFASIATWVALVATPIGAIVDILRTVICILLGCSPGIKPALESVKEVFTSVWNFISGFIGSVVNGVVTTISTVVDILVQLWESLSSGQLIFNIINIFFNTFISILTSLGERIPLLQPVFDLLIQVLTVVYNTIMDLVNIFIAFLNGQISLQELIPMVWNIISGAIRKILSTIIQTVISWGTKLFSLAINTGKNFVNGIIDFIKTLPGRVFSYITTTAGKIASGISSWVTKVRQGASNVVSAVVNGISSVPGKVAAEFGKIPQQIKSALKTAVINAFHGATALAEGVLNALGIHSPGIIQTAIRTEFENTVVGIKEKIKNAKDTASDFGSAILQGYNSNDMNLNMPQVSGTSSINTELNTNGAVQGMNDLVATSDLTFGQLIDTETNSMTMMSDDVSLQLNTMDLNQKNTMSNIIRTVGTNLNNITGKTKNAMLNNTKTTKTNLTSMQSSTATATKKMINAWNSMKNNIVTAAKNIKNESSTWFDRLMSNIQSFYIKLKNPGGAGGGAGSGGHRVGTVRSGKNPFEKLISKQQAKTANIELSTMGVKPVSIGEAIRGLLDTSLSAGNWSDITSSNVNKIKSVARNWSSASPKVGRYSTSSAKFKIKNFENGIPKIDYPTFRKLAEEVFSQTSYDFYYNSEKYGSWVRAFNAGSFNCSDGADALIWMANACGLPASKVHGHWNQFGHYWANVAGHKMDVTGWQNRRTWTPSASAGPAPIRKTNTNNENNTTEISGEATINLNINGLPNTVDTNTVVALFKEMFNDKTFIKALVNNNDFQVLDSKVKNTINLRNGRARGI